jgi:hypothetical protein
MQEPDVAREPHEETPGTVALYVASITEELAQMAKRQGLDSLGYILDMARLEAAQISKGVDGQDRWSVPPRSRRSG